MVYGPGHLWDGGITRRFGPVGLVVGPRSKLKLVYATDLAEAVVLAAERPEAVGEVVNVIGDDPPTQAAFASALRRRGLLSGRALPVPYRLGAAVASLAAATNHLLGERIRLPEVLDPARLAARSKPLEYPNAAAREVLGWTSTTSLHQALDRMVSRRAD
jgi:nucleoside-diphosphate-sugar epimerase